jgi:hypothetical protein
MSAENVSLALLVRELRAATFAVDDEKFDVAVIDKLLDRILENICHLGDLIRYEWHRNGDNENLPVFRSLLSRTSQMPHLFLKTFLVVYKLLSTEGYDGEDNYDDQDGDKDTTDDYGDTIEVNPSSVLDAALQLVNGGKASIVQYMELACEESAPQVLGDKSPDILEKKVLQVQVSVHHRYPRRRVL